jgi:hypothetical protein
MTTNLLGLVNARLITSKTLTDICKWITMRVMKKHQQGYTNFIN